MEIRGVRTTPPGPLRKALTRSFAKLTGRVPRPQPTPPPAPSETETSSFDDLAMRWFTPRGREARQELLYDLRHHEGAHAAEIVADLRQRGVADGRLDLRGIDLRGEDLASTYLVDADLTGAILDGCNLRHANLRGVTLAGASARKTDLRGAQLQRADLRSAGLEGANLREARLEGAQLQRARLREAYLHRARFADANLTRVDADPGAFRTAFLREPPPRRAPTRRFDTRGRVPLIEPRPRSPRTRTHVTRPSERPSPRSATRRFQPIDEEGARIIPSDAFQRARQANAEPEPHGDFDQALVELVGLRRELERIVVVVDGEARVLYLDEAAAERRAG